MYIALQIMQPITELTTPPHLVASYIAGCIHVAYVLAAMCLLFCMFQ